RSGGGVPHGFDLRHEHVLGGEGHHGRVSGVLAGFDRVTLASVFFDSFGLCWVMVAEADAAEEVPGVDWVDSLAAACQVGDGSGGGDSCHLYGFGDAEFESVGAGFVADDAVQRLQVEQFRRCLRELHTLLGQPALYTEVPDPDAAGAVYGGAVFVVAEVCVGGSDEVASHKAVCLRCAFDVPSAAVGGGGEGVHVDVTEVAASPGFQGDFSTGVRRYYLVDLAFLRERAVPKARFAVGEHASCDGFEDVCCVLVFVVEGL